MVGCSERLEVKPSSVDDMEESSPVMLVGLNSSMALEVKERTDFETSTRLLNSSVDIESLVTLVTPNND